jgi:amino acid transporter
MKRIIFFCTPFLSVNPSVIIFFYYEWSKNYRRKIHRQSIFVGDFVGKLITNGMIVQIPMKNSVSKSKDCGSGNTWLYIIPLLIPILLIRISPLKLHLHLCSNVCTVVKLFFNEYWNKKNWCSIKLVVFGFIVIFFVFQINNYITKNIYILNFKHNH